MIVAQQPQLSFEGVCQVGFRWRPSHLRWCHGQIHLESFGLFQTRTQWRLCETGRMLLWEANVPLHWEWTLLVLPRNQALSLKVQYFCVFCFAHWNVQRCFLRRLKVSFCLASAVLWIFCCADDFKSLLSRWELAEEFFRVMICDDTWWYDDASDSLKHLFSTLLVGSAGRNETLSIVSQQGNSGRSIRKRENMHRPV